MLFTLNVSKPYEPSTPKPAPAAELPAVSREAAREPAAADVVAGFAADDFTPEVCREVGVHALVGVVPTGVRSTAARGDHTTGAAAEA